MSTDGKKPDEADSSLDDWAAAVDEWDAALDLGVVVEEPKPGTAAAPQRTPPLAASDDTLDHDPSPSVEHPGEDPLVSLLAGEIELPEVLDHSLHGMLGDVPSTVHVAQTEHDAPLVSVAEELTVDLPGEPDMLPPVPTLNEPSDLAALTAWSPADLVLPDEIAVEQLGDLDPLDKLEPPTREPEMAIAPIAAGDDFPADDGWGDDLDGPVLPLPPAVPMTGAAPTADVLARLRLELDSFEEAAPVAAPPPPESGALTDSDFYDELSIDASAPPAAPAAGPPADLDLDLDLGFDAGPSTAAPVEPAPAPPPAVDATELVRDLAAQLGGVAPTDRPAASVETILPAARLADAVPPKRLPSAIPLPTVTVSATMASAAAADLPAMLAILDDELAQPGERQRKAQLATAAARIACDHGMTDAAEHYFALALEHEPDWIPALRGQRELAFDRGELDRAVDTLDREIAAGDVADRQTLQVLRADVLLAAQQADSAAASFAEVHVTGSAAVHIQLGLLQAACTTDTLTSASLRLLANTLSDIHSATALLYQAAILDEQRGADDAADAGFRDVLARDPGHLGAALGTLRLALRSGLERTHAESRVAELVGGAMAQALKRQIALTSLEDGQPAQAAALLADSGTDVPTLRVRARAERAAGNSAAEHQMLMQLAQLEPEAAVRASIIDRLTALGHGTVESAALAAANEALGHPRDADDPTDYRAYQRAAHLAIRQREGARLAALAHDAASRWPELGASTRWQSARDLVALGQTTDAERLLAQGLAEHPDDVLLASALCQCRCAAHTLDAGAQALLVVAHSSADSTTTELLSHRALRLLSTAGAYPEAFALATELWTAAPREQLIEQRLQLGLASGQEPAELLAWAVDQTASPWRAAQLLDELHRAFGERGDVQAARAAAQRAWTLVPGAPQAQVALELDAAGHDPAVLLELGQARIAYARGRPEGHYAQLDQARRCERLGQAVEATRLYDAVLVELSPSSPLAPGVAAALAASGRQSGELDPVVRALDLLGDVAQRCEPAEGPWRTALLVERAEIEELGLSRLEDAARTFAQAREHAPDNPLVTAGWWRTHQALGNTEALRSASHLVIEKSTDLGAQVAAHRALARLAEAAGDAEQVEHNLLAILSLDSAHHLTFRALERTYVMAARVADLIHLYEQMGLTAMDSGWAAAIFLELARLRRRLGNADQAAIDNDYRRALYRDAQCQLAVKRLLGSALARQDHAQIVELLATAAVQERHGPALAILATRAGEALEALGKPEAACERYRSAVATIPHLAAARGLARVALGAERYDDAASALEILGKALHDPAGRIRSHLGAGHLAERELQDRARALKAYNAVLDDAPQHHEALGRIQSLVAVTHDWQALAQALISRCEAETHPPRRVELLHELAALYRDQLGQRAKAKESYVAVLALVPGDQAALAALADLYYEDQEWAPAVDVMVRHARLSSEPEVLKNLFFRLGIIYAEHTPDERRAIVSFTRVLQVEPDNQVALEHLAELGIRSGEWRGALAAASRLVELASEPQERIARMHRVALVQEKGFRDLRAAQETLRRALELDPLNMDAIGKLADFFERQGDFTSARVHLDTSAQAMRHRIALDPYAPRPYHALYQIFDRRRSYDQAVVAASVLVALEQATSEEQTMLARFAERDPYPGAALAEPSVDELLFPRPIPPGFRQIFRLLGEPLERALRSDVKRLGIARSERLPRSGSALRDLAQHIADDLRISDFDIYVTGAAGQGRLLTVELSEPIALVFGQELLAGMSEAELRFCLGRCLKMVQCHMAVPLRLPSDELGLLLAGIVRQVVPDFLPRGLDETSVAAEAGRVARVVPRRLHQELVPFALECANPALDWRGLTRGLTTAADRAGLLCAGMVAPAVAVLRRLEEEERVRDLLRFSVSQDFTELRRLVGIAIAG